MNLNAACAATGGRLPAGDAPAACRAGLGFVPQERNVFASMTVRENLELGGYLASRDLDARIEEQLERFPLLRARLKDHDRAV